MLNEKRRWCVADIGNVEEIASGLTGNTQVLCTGIRWQGLLMLNDATSEDGGQEYAIIDEKTGYQVESLTCSWMTPESLEQSLRQLAAGEEWCVMAKAWTDQTDPRKRIESPDQHRKRCCALCA